MKALNFEDLGFIHRIIVGWPINRIKWK